MCTHPGECSWEEPLDFGSPRNVDAKVTSPYHHATELSQTCIVRRLSPSLWAVKSHRCFTGVRVGQGMLHLTLFWRPNRTKCFPYPSANCDPIMACRRALPKNFFERKKCMSPIFGSVLQWWWISCWLYEHASMVTIFL